MWGKHIRGRELAAYSDHELTPKAARRVEAHLARCARCRAERDGLTGARDLLAQHLPASVALTTAPEHLWDRIEAALDGAGAAAPARRQRRRGPAFGGTAAAVGVAAAAALVGLLAVSGPRDDNGPATTGLPSWSVAGLAGTPRINGGRLAGASPAAGHLRVGESLETDRASRARIDVADIGRVEIEPDTRIRLVRSGRLEHRLALDRGTLHAVIAAPPRRFFVDTPSAVAVDLGCAYTLSVDTAGDSLLRVTSGWVAFERAGTESVVPAGAVCRTRVGIGPGTPHFGDAPPILRNALAHLDTGSGGGKAARETALRAVLQAARKADTLTLWHLMPRVSADERLRVYDRLAALAPPPAGVTRRGALDLDRRMLDRWKADLEPIWYRPSAAAAGALSVLLAPPLEAWLDPTKPDRKPTPSR